MLMGKVTVDHVTIATPSPSSALSNPSWALAKAFLGSSEENSGHRPGEGTIDKDASLEPSEA